MPEGCCIRESTGEPRVTLRMMNLANRRMTVLDWRFGGQNTIKVPSWSPSAPEAPSRAVGA